MAPKTDERPPNAQEAFLADQRAAIERGDAPIEVGDVEYGPDAVHGYNTDETGESSTHNVINSPYIKQRLAAGRSTPRDPSATPFVGDAGEGTGRREIDRSHAAAAVGAERAEELRQEQAEATVAVEDAEGTQSLAAAADTPGEQHARKRAAARKPEGDKPDSE